jgi:hypothetical protein
MKKIFTSILATLAFLGLLGSPNSSLASTFKKSNVQNQITNSNSSNFILKHANQLYNNAFDVFPDHVSHASHSSHSSHSSHYSGR